MLPRHAHMFIEGGEFFQLTLGFEAGETFELSQLCALSYHPARALSRIFSAKRIAAATAAKCSRRISSPMLTVA